MRRSSRRGLISLVLFFIALSFIIYLNRPTPAQRYSWTRIRYVSHAIDQPEAHGICPSLDRTSKPALVVSRVTADGDSSWVSKLRDKYHPCIYTADEKRPNKLRTLQVPANRGHEAMAYLTFIIDNYDHIPDAGAVFVHGNRFAWHNDDPSYDNLHLLSQLNVSRAVARHGYANLKCDWSASTCDVRDSPPQGSLETSMRATVEPWNDRVVSDSLLPKALAVLFGGADIEAARLTLGRRDSVRSQCCAQFAVSKESILSHSRLEYRALRQWLLDGIHGPAKDAKDGLVAPRDDKVAGRILSYLWHILFLKGAQGDEEEDGLDLDRLNLLACPSASECYCSLYGRCELGECTAAGCSHQYSIPPGFALPENWASTHS